MYFIFIWLMMYLFFMGCICYGETLCFMFFLLFLVSHVIHWLLIYIKRLFMVYVFYFLFCEIKNFLLFYLYFPHTHLCVC